MLFYVYLDRLMVDTMKYTTSLNFLPILGALAFGLAANAAHSTTIAQFDYGLYAQTGSVTNQFAQNIVGFQIDFVPDSGTPVSPIWELPPIGSVGFPIATFTNIRDADINNPGAFTATFEGLNIANGDVFGYIDLDYGGFDDGDVSEALVPNLTGEEFATVFFANGSFVSAFFGAGSIGSGGLLQFDDSNLVTSTNSVVPLPAALPLFGTGLAIMGLLGWRRKRKVSA